MIMIMIINDSDIVVYTGKHVLLMTDDEHDHRTLDKDWLNMIHYDG